MSEELELLKKIHNDTWSAKWYAPSIKVMKYNKIAKMVNAYFKGLEEHPKLIWTKDTDAKTVINYFESVEKEVEKKDAERMVNQHKVSKR